MRSRRRAAATGHKHADSTQLAFAFDKEVVAFMQAQHSRDAIGAVRALLVWCEYCGVLYWISSRFMAFGT